MNLLFRRFVNVSSSVPVSLRIDKKLEIFFKLKCGLVLTCTIEVLWDIGIECTPQMQCLALTVGLSNQIKKEETSYILPSLI